MAWQFLLLVPVCLAVLYWLAAAVCVAIFMGNGRSTPAAASPAPYFPSVSLFKPVYGLEKDLSANLATACRQEYPEFEVIFAVQRQSDPALAIVEEVVSACPRHNARVVVDESAIGSNGKVNNLHNASRIAKGEVFVFSDSDMRPAPDYLLNIVSPLADEKTGIACTLYLAERPENLLEVLELLSYNADFVVSMLFAIVTGTAVACPGASLAIWREVLDEVGGLAPLCDDLVEDHALARRVLAAGYRIRFIPYTVGMALELRTPADWWRHQVSWDQKTKSASPIGYACTLFIRGVPFSLLYAMSGAPYGWTVFLATAVMRVATGIANASRLRDRDGLACIVLLPVRDVLALLVWLAALCKRNGSWRGRTFLLKKGKMLEGKG